MTEADGSQAIEVSLRDVNGSDFIYWVRLESRPQGVDKYDWAIQRAVEFHIKQSGTQPANQNATDECPVSAADPFTRYEGEFVWVQG